eukprot:1380154-Amorphochlora_amoeboformis.AAC.2
MGISREEIGDGYQHDCSEGYLEWGGPHRCPEAPIGVTTQRYCDNAKSHISSVTFRRDIMPIPNLSRVRLRAPPFARGFGTIAREVDVAVIGGGIIGCGTARELLGRFSREIWGGVGYHRTSSRNSRKGDVGASRGVGRIYLERMARKGDRD